MAPRICSNFRGTDRRSTQWEKDESLNKQFDTNTYVSGRKQKQTPISHQMQKYILRELKV